METGRPDKSSMNGTGLFRIIKILSLSVIFLIYSVAVFAEQDNSSLPLRIGYYENPPLMFSDAQKRADGLIIEIFSNIARQEHWQVQYIACPFSQCLEKLRKGEIDVVPFVAYSAERASQYDFSNETIFGTWAVTYVPKDKPIASILDLKNRRVAVKTNDIHSIAFRELVRKFGIPVTFVQTPGYDEAFEAASSGQADAAIVGRTFGVKKARQLGLVGTSVIFNPIEGRVAFTAGKHKTLVALVDKNIRLYMDDPLSSYYMLLSKWIGGSAEKDPVWLYGLGIMSILILGLVVFIAGQKIKKTVTELRDSEERFSTAFEASPDSITITTLDEGRFVAVNRSVLGVTGYSRDELIGQTTASVSIWVEPEERMRFVERLIINGSIDNYETNFRVKEGHVLSVSISARIIMIKKNPHLLSVVQDMTEKKAAASEREKLQSQLFQAQKSEAIGTLAGGIAHDFNNILNAMMGYISLFLSKAPPGIDVGFIKKAEMLIDRAASLTSGLLAFSRKQQADMSRIDVNEIVGQFHVLLARVIGEHIILQMHPARGPLIIEGNRGLIEQVFMNMAINARDAMPNGGELRVEVDAVELSEAAAIVNECGRPGSYARISITDTGCGMDSETTRKIFDPFFTTKAVGRGTGLGLAISLGTIRHHGGNITVYSEPGIGTTFRIYLPLSGNAPEFIFTEHIDSISGGNETILLVEDFEPARETMRIVLEGNGFRVIEAVDGVDAMAKFRAAMDEIALIVTDVIMPNLNGRDFANMVRLVKPDMKFIFVSGYTSETLHEKWNEDLAIVMSKPFSPARLVNKIREVLDEQKS